ncbi:Peroxygenase 1 [Tilletia horrida]|uniref:Peroxygenase 1 n=1 Tax=Tilletia horrida TaxID=155126 RepID=A0AAN6JJ64_9BASI|nr:Peroxygenase 1 [Tilletia horrida]KAK0526315.1 Peroxygenase 1 [Tilletia horrida]KAK0558742.1 Peroxygenase 1 [Tilletia horrida]
MSSSSASSSSVSIRQGTPADIPTILKFIMDLAIYEKEPDAVKATPELVQENIFDRKYAEVLIAEDTSTSPATPIGLAIYFFSYSTWTAKPSLYLEDLYVDGARRNAGVGKAIFRALGKVAQERGCARMDWSVLTWNAPSIAFYEKTLGATRMEEWRQMRLDEEGIKRLETLGL